MPISFTIDPDARLVVYTVEGNATRAEAIEFLDTVIAHPDFRRGFDFLGDRRDVVRGQSSAYVYGITDEINARQESIAPCLWAVIVADEYAYGMSHMWATMTQRSKVNIRPFRNAEEATVWLGADPSHIPQRFIPSSREIVRVGS